MEQRVEFPDLLRECIHDGVEGVLGWGGMQVLLYHFQLDQYWEKPREFHINLHFALGPGSVVLEKMIVKELFRRLNVPYAERDGFDFERYVNYAQEIFAAKPNRG